jgi:cytochrome c peroxidase
MALDTESDAVAVLNSIPEYVGLFRKAFPGEKDPISFDNIAKAIGAFERGLVTPSRWDKYLAGQEGALTAAERAGFEAFTRAGCQACHSGPYLGGQIYQKLGLTKEWPEETDLGRYLITQKKSDLMVFKVPSLRNIDRTAPYFHNGRVATLEEAVAKMAEYQVGKELTKSDISAILAFLRTLTGDIPKEYIQAPPLPRSTDRTPKPRLT